ncbi:MAG: PAS domain S-box protein [Theionarchaea archaeon]|nr:PAS domain S-box protein [Theionarchaea archaeon]
MSEEKRELIDQALRILIEDTKDAFFILDREGKVQFLNKKAEKLTNRCKKDFMGKRFEDVVTIATEQEIKSPFNIKSRKVLRTWMETPKGTIPVKICLKPVMQKELMGTVLIVTAEPQRSENFRLLETLGSAIQRQSSAQKIYETLGKELATLGVTLAVLPFEKEWFTIGYHTVDSKKMHITEFIMGIPLSKIKLTMTKDALQKMREQKSLFFHDISSLVESAASNFATSELHKFFSLVGFSQGVAVPVTAGDDFTGVLALFSEGLHPEDAFVASAVGVQVSAALERAHIFEQLVTDLKVLEEQISARTRELEKVKSQMESIVQSSVDAIMAADLGGSITFVNKGVRTMLGYSEAEIVGQPITTFYAGGKKEAKRLKKIIVKDGQIENTELDFLAEGGRIVHTLASLSLLKDQKGASTGIMAVLKDVTEQKRLQQTLESLNKAAFRIQKSKTREDIFTVTAEELKQFDFHVVFILFDERKTAGKIEYITAGKILDTLDEEGITLSNFELSLDNPLFKRIKKKEAVYIDDVYTAAKLIVPPRMYEASEKGINLLGITHKKAILAPLIIHDEPIGLLAVISDVITSGDTPSIIAFANQVSTALENARLLEEVQNRADELVRNVKEQQLLRELNTKLFLAQSQEEVLDAAIEGIHTLGRSFANISMLNEERTHARPVRLEMESNLLKMVEKTGKAIIPGFTLWEYDVPICKEDTIYHTFFENQIPLISSNITVHRYLVLKAELSQLYKGFANKDSVVQRIIEKARKILPYQSLMVFPIVVGGQTIGSLSVTSEKVFTEEDFILMRTVGEMVSSAMERINQSEKLTETLSELRAVQKITALLNMGASLQEILVDIASSIRDVYHYQFAFPVLLDPSRKYLTFEHIVLPSSMAKKLYKLVGVDLENFKYPLTGESPMLTQVLKEKKCVIVKGFEGLAEAMTFGKFKLAVKKLAPDISKIIGVNHGEINIMFAPLRYGKEVIGILFLGHRKVLTQEDFQQLEYFLDQVGIAIAKSEVESRLRQSLKELRELDQMKSEFIDIASHELRTPLTTLKLYLEMMAMEQYGTLSQPLRERIRVMEEGVNRLEEIINQTLVASRLIKNKLMLEKESVSLLDISTEVVRQLRPLWKAKNQNLFLESPPDLSRVEGDQKALFTAVNNLVDNAIRYSAENTEIYIRFIEHPKEVECVIADQGCGIPPELTEKIFDEFYIVPSETEYARIDGRTGLGLFIAKGIVERHNGRIWVESLLGEGSIFHIVLPKESD